MIEREYLIASLRCAKLRISLLGNELDTIGVALKYQVITPDAAIAAINDLGVWTFLLPEIGVDA
jgi:hypothetical protein